MYKAPPLVLVSSPVASNPNTSRLETVFDSFGLVPDLRRCSKLVQFDGPQEHLPQSRKDAYAEFKRRVRELASGNPGFARTTVSESEAFLFAARNLEAAVWQVRTTFMIVCIPAGPVSTGLFRRLAPACC